MDYRKAVDSKLKFPCPPTLLIDIYCETMIPQAFFCKPARARSTFQNPIWPNRNFSARKYLTRRFHCHVLAPNMATCSVVNAPRNYPFYCLQYINRYYELKQCLAIQKTVIENAQRIDTDKQRAKKESIYKRKRNHLLEDDNIHENVQLSDTRTFLF